MSITGLYFPDSPPAARLKWQRREQASFGITEKFLAGIGDIQVRMVN